MNTSLICLLLLLLPLLASCVDTKVYIVYLRHNDDDNDNGKKTLNEIEESHVSYLFSIKKFEEGARSSLLYSYKHSINGFAALLTADEASQLSDMKEVVMVIPSHEREYSLHTTRSWEFVGLDEELKPNQVNREDLLFKSQYGKDVIVGMMDSGVWPESESFSDRGMGPIPVSWKGICQTGPSFKSTHCNRKLIGARYYLKGYEARYGPLNTTTDSRSPRDMDGHGTHTASTVGGRGVPNASSLGGFSRGTAFGGAPMARLAIYKVCWPVPSKGKEDGNTCLFEDMLAAIDDAIRDGVHILSISIGSTSPIDYTQDGLALGALQATKNNILVVCSGGNEGPTPSTVVNTAPWIFTVAASSIDRAFVAPIQLGNGHKIKGESATPYKLPHRKMYQLVYAGEVVNADVPNTYIAGQCLPGSLSPQKAKGKIVFCLRGNGTRVGKGMEVKRAGGIGYILGNSPRNGAELTVDAHVLPATSVTSDDAIKILQYINSTKTRTAYIYPGKTVLQVKPAPLMAAFSSRGPNAISPEILKPDIAAPGLNILAAWTGGNAPTKIANDHRRVKYNLLSGTSMACPHVAAAAALLKAIHPDWSSAAIKSALITTAGTVNNVGTQITDASGNKADPFQYGSGHFRPEKAADPGLVYDASYTDYLLFLCSRGDLKSNPAFTCPQTTPSTQNLNYPTFSFPQLNGKVTVGRTVTNVGGKGSVYFASVEPPMGITVKVSPPVLHFNRAGETKSFELTVEGSWKAEKGVYSFGWLTWSDGIHIVRSPIAVSTV
ncbi:putative tripeptidyl-peptidase II [Helianthus annuus]|uniref:Putative subtilase family protein n=1 Tax=Helianthus annuus TaxID=4232 RepID=A0A251UZ41_HELAN|nr:subtilisin-like protease SBT5.6 [Helianthus annuus]KAF5810797.1 putative tripeptidyl-peptidase II [Helianthus annuus]KAJ0581553.1 putative tripeptidyl-peptidase II [Helianthus annuus]KAJ0597516.1 putative tripeptidyl-peptidase II [Helianthus annuus]KAJ0758165.1 putative tripeptidyl-peptidase II [Helianthus annuus]KAJ0761821.1 putative tripeptidyl-peptidase II [Helianthus annuus]